MERKREFCGVQILRGVAASVVAMSHTAGSLRDNNIADFPGFPSGSAGVDLFFLISGFVMIVSSYDEKGATLSWSQFLSRRFQRIIPLYWFFITLKLTLIWVRPATFRGTSFNLVNALCSYLFIPSYNSQHLIQPVISAGWTLNFEMFFYYAFAVCLAFAISPFRWLSIAFAVLASLGMLGVFGSAPVATLFGPLLLEFVGGIWLAKVLVLDRKSVPAPAAICSAAAGLILIGLTELLPAYDLFNYSDLINHRVILWAPGAAAILFGFVALEDRGYFKRFRFPLLVGDASYSIYLTHVQVIPLVMSRVQGHSYSFAAAVAIFLFTSALCVACGILVYFTIERPMTRFLKSMLQTGRKAQSVPA